MRLRKIQVVFKLQKNKGIALIRELSYIECIKEEKNKGYE